MVELVKTERGNLYWTEGAALEFVPAGEGVIEFVWSGVFETNSVELIRAYLGDFLDLANTADAPVHMLHDLNDLTRYSKECLVEHTLFSRANGDRIGRIAVVSRRAMVFLGVTTVAAWQRRPIKNFSDKAAALAWLQRDEPRRCG